MENCKGKNCSKAPKGKHSQECEREHEACYSAFKPKIIQICPMPNNEYYQGQMLGLGDDGVVYEGSFDGWTVHMPLVFPQSL